MVIMDKPVNLWAHNVNLHAAVNKQEASETA